METKTNTAKFSVGDKVTIHEPDYPFFHDGETSPLEGKRCSVMRVDFPGDSHEDCFGLPVVNGTGAIKYSVLTEEPDPRPFYKNQRVTYWLSARSLVLTDDYDRIVAEEKAHQG